MARLAFVAAFAPQEALAWGFGRVFRRFCPASGGMRGWRAHAAAFGALVLLFLAARGSIGTFPLTPNRIPSTGQPVFDAAVVNGPIALAAAWSDWRRDAGLPRISEAEARRAGIRCS